MRLLLCCATIDTRDAAIQYFVPRAICSFMVLRAESGKLERNEKLEVWFGTRKKARRIVVVGSSFVRSKYAEA